MPHSAARLSSILMVAARHAGPALTASGDADPFGVDEAIADPRAGSPERLASDLESLGATFVKLGQLMSTRYDLLPGPYTEALQRLQDGVEPFDIADVHATIEEDLGARTRDLYSSFDEQPLASASIGQVHKAVTRSGRDVVVKVQRPGVRGQVRADMEALDQVAKMVDATRVGRRVGTQAMLAHFRRTLADELDYRKEAANLELFGRLAEPEDLIVVPKPYREFSSSRVLTMDRINGKKVTDVGPLGLMDIDGPALADSLFGFMLRTMLDEGLLHADPHPGNLLVTDDGRIGLIDLGMVTTVPKRLQSRLVKLLLAVSEADGEAVAATLASLGHPLEDYDAASFRDEVSHLVSGTLSLGADLQAGTILVELVRLSGDHGLRPPAEMSLVGKTLMNLDQSAQHLDPSFEPAAAIADHLPRVLTASAKPSLASVAVGALESKEFVENLPRRANQIVSALADGELEVRVRAIDEDRVLRDAHRMVNRLTIGVVLAAITIAAALMTRSGSGPLLFGYPALAVVFFLLAAIGGLALVVSIVLSDRRSARLARLSQQRRESAIHT
ncbi:MAG: AarF/UbiB family protein [Dermatophilus congolensis]|nr:AarF/UbiB family protein [Dermatophilus congolensis]